MYEIICSYFVIICHPVLECLKIHSRHPHARFSGIPALTEFPALAEFPAFKGFRSYRGQKHLVFLPSCYDICCCKGIPVFVSGTVFTDTVRFLHILPSSYPEIPALSFVPQDSRPPYMPSPTEGNRFRADTEADSYGFPGCYFRWPRNDF